MSCLQRTCSQRAVQGRGGCPFRATPVNRRIAIHASTAKQQQTAASSQSSSDSSGGPAEAPQQFLLSHLLQHHSLSSLQAAGPTSLALAAAALLCLLPAGAAHASDPQHIHHLAQAQFDLAEETDFWANVARYGRYFVTVMLGTGYVMVKPFMNAFKNPVSGVLAVTAVVALVFGIKVTLELMLGLTATDYPIE